MIFRYKIIAYLDKLRYYAESELYPDLNNITKPIFYEENISKIKDEIMIKYINHNNEENDEYKLNKVYKRNRNEKMEEDIENNNIKKLKYD